jgi:hypothetical protein
MNPAGFRPKKDCPGRDPATTENYRPDLSSEGAPHNNKPATVFKKKIIILVAGPTQTDRRSQYNFEFDLELQSSDSHKHETCEHDIT